MKINVRHAVTAAALVATQCFAVAAHAQWLDAVKGQMGGSLPSSSLSPATAGNAAGVLEFCMKNNYLSGGDAQALKDKLMGKVSGGSSQAKSDSGYLAGVQGMLNGSDGKSVDLSGGGLKEELTRKACDQVLKHGKSFL
ncbi:DUF2501 domain-containing protein [Achromobacter deleyi]|jgi:hypothetical protein|uniref:DUF2501 domain-containing protein n=1 Tax=Achromobacter deleyi TaxID=1353891 RepID=UPI000FC20A26|nr:DUF2501 domain-containing protein [Achromobacter deleyi]QVQ25243.1 DUF2501 domain-containing protein [Achromobacter deleyi]UIP20785.1 DUF2501 domain-containing protein [Achromobacter deleyi]